MEGVSMELQPLSCTYMSGIFLITNTYSKAKTFWPKRRHLAIFVSCKNKLNFKCCAQACICMYRSAIRRGSSTVYIYTYSQWPLLEWVETACRSGLPIWWCVIVSSAALLCKVISEKFLRHVKLHVFMAQEVTAAPKSHTSLNACSAGESGARI